MSYNAFPCCLCGETVEFGDEDHRKGYSKRLKKNVLVCGGCSREAGRRQAEKTDVFEIRDSVSTVCTQSYVSTASYGGAREPESWLDRELRERGIA